MRRETGWRSLPTDPGAVFDREVTLDAGALTPYVTWGTNPAQAAPLGSVVPDPATMSDPAAPNDPYQTTASGPYVPGRPLTVARNPVYSGTKGRVEEMIRTSD